MKRLTERDEYGNADIIALSDMMPELYAELSFSETNALTDALNKLADFEDAEENSTLIKLPCKVGDTVYIISKVTSPKFSKGTNGIINGVTSETKLEIHKKPFYYDLLPLMGDLCFTTREKAEKALKERESE